MRSNYAFLEIKGIGDLARKMVETKKGCHIFISLFAYEVSFDPFCRDCNNKENFFSNEICKESTTQSNGRSMNE